MNRDGQVDVAAVRRGHPIEAVVAEAGVELRRTGRGLLGCCPFHDDSTASLSVGGVPDRFHCFGCGASGDVIDFVQRLHHVGFREAVDLLEGSVGHHPRPVNPRAAADSPLPSVEPARAYEINALAWEHHTGPVAHATALAYLHRRRGIDLTVAESRADGPLVGYAGPGWTGLVEQLRRAGVTQDEMLTLDLAQVSSRGTLIDTLRNRVIVPVTTPDGRINGLIGRDTSGSERAPKYRNPTRTPVFDKATALYMPVQADRRDPTVVVVEGPLDALAITAAAASVPARVQILACSTNGTAVSAAQARRVMSLTTGPIVIALDGDPAGAAGTDRWLDVLCRQAHRPALVTTLPSGADPASWLAERGPTGLSAFDPNTRGRTDVAPHQPQAERVRRAVTQAPDHLTSLRPDPPRPSGLRLH